VLRKICFFVNSESIKKTGGFGNPLGWLTGDTRLIAAERDY
jgi:hypothetical protein